VDEAEYSPGRTAHGPDPETLAGRSLTPQPHD
jgi:hypothetical protein